MTYTFTPKGILSEPVVSKNCPFCKRTSKSWGWTVEHINQDHWGVTEADYTGEYCFKCERFFPSGRQAMKHILENHKNEPTNPVDPLFSGRCEQDNHALFISGPIEVCRVAECTCRNCNGEPPGPSGEISYNPVTQEPEAM
jgi:hypothetical protein